MSRHSYILRRIYKYKTKKLSRAQCFNYYWTCLIGLKVRWWRWTDLDEKFSNTIISIFWQCFKYPLNYYCCWIFQVAGSLNKNRNVSLVFRFWTKDKNEKALIGNVLNISSDVFVVSSDVLLRVQMSTRSADSSFFLSIALQRVIVLQLQAKHYKVGTF